MADKIIQPLNADFDALAKTIVSGANAKPTLPVARYAGTISISESDIGCAVLEDGTRLLTQSDMMRALGRARQAKGRGFYDSDVNLPAFLTAKNLKPFIPKDLYVTSSQIKFLLPNGKKAYGYKADLLPQVCEVYLEARDAGALVQSQMHVAQQADILVRGLARVGITALVDEATGYQDDRAKDALADIFAEFLTAERQKWTRTFPIDFYKEIYRLRGWEFKPWTTKRPSVIANWTDNFVYDRLAPQITEELRRKNPKSIGNGRRKDKHHQWFNPENGHPRLKEHLSGVIALLRASETWDQFLVSLDRAYPKFGNTIELPLTGGSNNE